MPDPHDTPATGAWKYLSPLADVQAALGAYSLADPNPSFAGKAWIFSGNMVAQIKGSQASAAVLTDAGGWGAPTILATSRFMRLRLDIWTDPLRDSNGNIIATAENTTARCLDVFRVIHAHLQRRDSDVQVWGDLVTVSCQLLTEPDPVQMPDGDVAGMGAMIGSAVYGIEVTGWTDAAA